MREILPNDDRDVTRNDTDAQPLRVQQGAAQPTIVMALMKTALMWFSYFGLIGCGFAGLYGGFDGFYNFVLVNIPIENTLRMIICGRHARLFATTMIATLCFCVYLWMNSAPVTLMRIAFVGFHCGAITVSEVIEYFGPKRSFKILAFGAGVLCGVLWCRTLDN